MITMTESELISYIKENFPKENETCDWKEFSNLKHSISGREGNDAITYISAFSNMNGGYLVIGVKDKTFAITGIQDKNDYTPENLPYRILPLCTNLPSEGFLLEEFKTIDTNKIVWILEIPKHNPRKPVYAHKKAWQRIGDSLIQLTQEREQSILNETLFNNDDWSIAICENATIDDLDQTAIEKARTKYKDKYPEHDVESWDNTTFLNKAKLTIQNKITRAAILLLGKPESDHFLSPAQTKITWVLKDKEGNEKDYQHFSCPFILAVDELYKKIRNLKYRYIKGQTLFPDEIDQYDPYIIRETLNNAIVHQDYSLHGKINVVEKEDGELIFENLGSFIPGSLDNVIKFDRPPSRYRNYFLSLAMVNLKMIDTIGSGIRRMFKIQRDRFFPMLDYDFTNKMVKVVIYGKVLDIEYANLLAQKQNLDLNDIILLDKLQKKKELSDEEALYLRKKRLIEGRKPNYHLSAIVARVTGQKAVYTKNKPFDDPYYKDLILKGIKEHGSLSRKDIDELLIDKLGNIKTKKQKKNKVKNILTDLRKENKIKNIGTKRQSIWAKN